MYACTTVACLRTNWSHFSTSILQTRIPRLNLPSWPWYVLCTTVACLRTNWSHFSTSIFRLWYVHTVLAHHTKYPTHTHTYILILKVNDYLPTTRWCKLFSLRFAYPQSSLWFEKNCHWSIEQLSFVWHFGVKVQPVSHAFMAWGSFPFSCPPPSPPPPLPPAPSLLIIEVRRSDRTFKTWLK